eukprot:1464317-Rhodomonas_salina.5
MEDEHMPPSADERGGEREADVPPPHSSTEHPPAVKSETAESADGEDIPFGCWEALGAAPAELQCDVTLVCGQSFRWRETGEREWFAFPPLSRSLFLSSFSSPSSSSSSSSSTPTSSSSSSSSSPSHHCLLAVNRRPFFCFFHSDHVNGSGWLRTGVVGDVMVSVRQRPSDVWLCAWSLLLSYLASGIVSASLHFTRHFPRARPTQSHLKPPDVREQQGGRSSDQAKS